MNKLLLTLLSTLIFVSPLVFGQEKIVKIEPNEKSLCPCEMSSFEIIITNTGNETETYNITIEGIPEYWYSLSESSVTVNAGYSKKIFMFITPYCFDKPGSYDVKVSVEDSTKGYDVLRLNVLPCRALRITLPESIQTCSGEEHTMSLVVENIGDEKEDVVLNLEGNASDFVSLDEDSFTLKPNENKTVKMRIKPSDLGQYTLIVNARSTMSYASDRVSSIIDVIECYRVSTDVPEEVKTCVNLTDTFDIIIENTGLKPDVYKIKIDGVPSDWFEYTESIAVEPNTTELVIAKVTGQEIGEYILNINTSSHFTSDQDKIKLIVEKCYDVSIIPDKEEIEVTECRGLLTRAEVKNTGTREDSYDIKLVDMNWSYVKPNKLELEPNQSKPIFVYFSPPFNTTGEFNFTILVKSKYLEASKTIKAVVSLKEKVNVTLPTTTTSEVTPVEEKPKVIDLITSLLEKDVVKALLVGAVITVAVVALVYFFVLRA